MWYFRGEYSATKGPRHKITLHESICFLYFGSPIFMEWNSLFKIRPFRSWPAELCWVQKLHGKVPPQQIFNPSSCHVIFCKAQSCLNLKLLLIHLPHLKLTIQPNEAHSIAFHAGSYLLKGVPCTVYKYAPFIQSFLLMSTTFHPSPRRPLPLRLESRRASILSLSNFESNLGLQQPQVDLDLDNLDTLKTLIFSLWQPKVNLPPHPPSYQDSSGLPAYQDTFQVNEENTRFNTQWQFQESRYTSHDPPSYSSLPLQMQPPRFDK